MSLEKFEQFKNTSYKSDARGGRPPPPSTSWCATAFSPWEYLDVIPQSDIVCLDVPTIFGIYCFQILRASGFHIFLLTYVYLALKPWSSVRISQHFRILILLMQWSGRNLPAQFLCLGKTMPPNARI